MGLGDRGKKRMRVDTPPTVDELFKATEASADEGQDEEGKKVGRPKGISTKPKTFTLPIDLNRRLRLFAFEHECTEVDVVRAALEMYLDSKEKK